MRAARTSEDRWEVVDGPDEFLVIKELATGRWKIWRKQGRPVANDTVRGRQIIRCVEEALARSERPHPEHDDPRHYTAQVSTDGRGTR